MIVQKLRVKIINTKLKKNLHLQAKTSKCIKLTLKKE